MKNLYSLLHQYDPGFPALKRSLKTFAAIAVSLIIYHNNPRMAMFASIVALLVSRSQTGITLGERKFTLMLTGFLLALLSVPASLISAHSGWSVVFLIIFAFLVFFLAGLKIVPDFPAIVVLSVIVVEMAFSHTVESGVQFAGLYVLVTLLVYVLHFVIFPTRPLVRLKTQSNLIHEHLEKHVDLIFSNFDNLESAIALIHRSSEKVQTSIKDFRRLWQLFNVRVGGEQDETASLLRNLAVYEKVNRYLVLVWQYRAGSFSSDVYRQNVLKQPVFTDFFRQVLVWHFPKQNEQGIKEVKWQKEKLSELETLCLSGFEESTSDETRDEWMAVFSTIRVFGIMMEDVLVEDVKTTAHDTVFSAKEKVKSFFTMLTGVPSKINLQNTAFRFGLRSAFIVGATMFFYKFLNIDYGYWLVLFAVLLIRPNLGISIKTGRDRLAGTIVGSLIAFLFLMIAPTNSGAFYVALLLNLFLMIWFANLDKMVPMVITLTFIIISLFALIYPGENDLAFLRIVYTAGIVVLVIFLTFIIWPDRARIRLGDALAIALEMEKNYFSFIVSHLIRTEEMLSDSTTLKRQIDARIISTRELFEAAGNEVLQPGILRHGRQILVYIQRLCNTLHTLEQTGLLCRSAVDFQDLNVEMNRFFAQIESAFAELANAIRTLGLPKNYPDLTEEFRLLNLSLNHWIVKGSVTRKDVKLRLQNSLFLWNFKPLILELDGIKGEILMKMGEG